VQQSRGIPAGRIPIGDLLKAGELALQERFGKLEGNFDTMENSKKTTWIETVADSWLYLNDRLIASRGLKKDQVALTLANALRAVPNVQAAYTRAQLEDPDRRSDPIGELVRRSFHADRSGDVCVVPKPNFLISAKNYVGGTSHGTPHDYDRHVPLLVFGPGVPGGERREEVHPQHAAAILAHFLGLKPPAQTEYGLPKSLFED
jgi:hypothetical protein